MTDHIYLEALQNYLQSSEWRESIHVFVSSNCGFFSNVDDYHPEQHKIWKNFQDVCESILQNMLFSIGGSMDELESAMGAVQSKPSRGPRDETIKDILEQLFSCEDFPHFASMMHRAYIEEIGVEGDDVCHQLMRMGFSADHILTAVDKYGSHADVEVLITFLSELMAPQSESKHQYSSPSRKEMKQDYKAEGKSSSEMRSNKVTRSSVDMDLSPALPVLQDFALVCYQQTHETVDYDDLFGKFQIADGVIDAYKESSADAKTESADNLLDLVQWAVEMKEFGQDVILAYEEGLPYGDVKSHNKNGLISWYRELEEKFSVLNSNSLFQEEEMERMRLLDKIASQHDEDEQYLHACINNYDNTYKQVNKCYKKCSVITLTNPEVQTADLEEVYLLLKQHMNVAQERDSTDIYEQMFNHPSLQKFQRNNSTELLQLLLDLSVLEAELIHYKQEIQRLIGSPGRRAGVSGESSGGGGGGGLFDDNDADMLINFQLVEDITNMDESPPIPHPSAHLSHATSPTPTSANPLAPLPPQFDPLLTELKDQHRNALIALKNTFFDYKQRALSALEERLHRKKLLLLRAQENGSSGADTESQDILQAEIRALEKDLDQASKSLGSMQEILLEGYRDKCVLQLTSVKSHLGGLPPSHPLTPSSLSLDDILATVKSSNTQTEDERYAQAVKERYERERNEILLEHESKRRDAYTALQRRLAMRVREGPAGAGVSADELVKEWECVAEGLDADLVRRLGTLQEGEVVQLGGGSIPPSLLPRTRNDDNGDDKYLDDVTRKSSPLEGYLARLDKMKIAYSEATSQLTEELLRKRREGIKNRIAQRNKKCSRGGALTADEVRELLEEAGVAGGIAGLAEGAEGGGDTSLALDLLSGVVLDSYTQHLADPSHKQQDMKEMQDRARIGILEAFEEAKTRLKDAQSGERQRAAEGLNKRRAARAAQQSSRSPVQVRVKEVGECGGLDAGEGALEGLLEEVMDSFLSPPAANTTKVTVWKGPAYLLTDRDMDTRYSGQGTGSGLVGAGAADKERTERMRKQHEEREKALQDDLYTDMMDKKKKLEDRVRKKREREQRAQSKAEMKSDAKDTLDQEMEAEGQADDDGDDGMSAIHNMLDSLTTASGKGPSHPLPNPSSSKDDYSNEARKIASSYAQEQQKHDLLMKIEQTRQKQLLQKKLWERTHTKTTTAHGFHRQYLTDMHDQIGEGLAEEDDEVGGAGVRDGSIEIGQFRSRIPSQRVVHQPVVRGLSLDKIPSIGENRLASMSKRGMDLTRFQRK